MKLLKIKSYLIGFIVVMISLFSFNNNAYASEATINIDTSDYWKQIYGNIDSETLGKLDLIKQYLENNIEVPYVMSIWSGYNEINSFSVEIKIVKENKWWNSINFNDDYTSRYITMETSPKPSGQQYGVFAYFTTNQYSGTLSERLDTLLSKLEEWNINRTYKDNYRTIFHNFFAFTYDENYEVKFDKYISNSTLIIPYSTNLELPYNEISKMGNNIKLNINNKEVKNGTTLKEIISYLSVSKIELSKAYANDLDGNDLYNIRADFANIYSESYTYQFKTDFFNDWVDITDNIKTAAQEGYYIYDYSCYYNTNIHFRVLDSNGEVIDENSISVSELNNFDMEISHNPANDLQGRYVNAVTVNLHNCWNDNYTYQYSFDNETFYNMEVNNKQFILNHGIQTFLYFRILDENNNIIYTRDYEVIFDGLIKSVVIDEDVKTGENNEKFIIANISFKEFAEFNDTYNLKYYLNDRELDGSTSTYIYEWNKEQYYSFKGVEIVVKIDNFVVYSAFYLPSMGDKTFEDKYDEVVEDNLEEELGDNDYSDVNGMLEAVKSFINAIKNFINAFFSLILVFFNRLNIWIKSMLIGLFIVMVICRIIKAVRK